MIAIRCISRKCPAAASRHYHKLIPLTLTGYFTTKFFELIVVERKNMQILFLFWFAFKNFRKEVVVTTDVPLHVSG